MLYEFGITRRASFVGMTLVVFVGAIAGLAALRRHREAGWHMGVVSVALNVTAWWLRLMQVDWAAIRSAFDS
jgi:hypothetical protein